MYRVKSNSGAAWLS